MLESALPLIVQMIIELIVLIPILRSSSRLGLGVSVGWCPMCSYLRIAGLVQPGFERVRQA